jgi:Ca2+-binding RTX toxin-like protein
VPSAAGVYPVTVTDNGVGAVHQAFSVEVAEPAPLCQGQPATVWVNRAGRIVGGPDGGKPYGGTLRGTMGNDVIAGPAGGLNFIFARDGNDLVCAGGGIDVVDAGHRVDTVHGGAGNDLLIGGAGTDACDGGAGTDAPFTCEQRTGFP